MFTNARTQTRGRLARQSSTEAVLAWLPWVNASGASHGRCPLRGVDGCARRDRRVAARYAREDRAMTFVPGVVPPPTSSPQSVWFLTRSSQGGPELVVRRDGDRVSLPGLDDARGLGVEPSDSHFVGRLNGEDCYAVAIAETELPAPLYAEGLRNLYIDLDDEVFSVAARAAQIAVFGATHRFCGRCASPTVRHSEERCVACPSCGLVCYPRLSPAIIVLVRRGKEALLARGRRGVGFFSTLAGFVEVGESLEETLHREVREEVGIEVTNIRYSGSQPWPFPHSLMVGFTADYAGGEIVTDPREIAEAAWFSPDALPPIPPPKLSIARRLIDAWLADVGAPLERANERTT